MSIFLNFKQKKIEKKIENLKIWAKNGPKMDQKRISRMKRLSYLLEIFCWHILAKFKKNRWSHFFFLSPKNRQ